MIILSALILVFLAVVAGFVLASHLFAWYEQANLRPELMARRFAPSSLAFALSLMLRETLWLVITILLLPWGWLPPWRRRIPRQRTPILFLHGLFQNRACWLYLRLRLRLLGIPSLHAINLPPWKDIESLTERVAIKVDELRLASGCERVHLVGHSMGGIIARNYVQLRGGAPKVERCILLAAPNGGSKLAALALSPLAKSLLPGSELLRRLAQAPLPADTHLTALYSRHDNIVLPPTNARLDGVENIELVGIGHTSLLYHEPTLKALAALLGERAA